MEDGTETGSATARNATDDLLGYRYREVGPRIHEQDDFNSAFEGNVGYWSLPSGVSVCISRLTALRDSTNQGTLPKSLNIITNFGGSRMEFGFGNRDDVALARNATAIACASDSVPLHGTSRTGQTMRKLLVQIRPEDLEDTELAEHLDRLICGTRISATGLSTRGKALLQQLIAPSANGLVGRLMAESYALEVLANLLKPGDGGQAETTRVSVSDKARLNDVHERLIADPGHQYTLTGLAQDIGMSASALREKFQLLFGKSIFELLREVRLDQARLLIEQDGWTVSQAAYYVGYRHQSNFSTAFRRRFGIPPSRLRSQSKSSEH